MNLYADYNGSGPLHNSVASYLSERINEGPYGNPNAIHSLGRKMLFGIEGCRKIIAQLIGCEPRQIIFNSGSSEGISQVFFHFCAPYMNTKNCKKKIIISPIEHSAVINAAHFYQEHGIEVLRLSVDENGVIKLNELETLMNKHSSDVLFTSIMAANNETGVVQPYKEIGQLCSQHKVPYFSDTTQLIGKGEFNFQESNTDFAVLSGHKIGALIGSGLIIVKNPESFKPLIFGGGQEQGLRGGTQNYVGIETIAVALEALNKDLNTKLNKLAERRDNFEKKLTEFFPQIKIVSQNAKRLPGTMMFSYPGVHGQALQIELESLGIFVTTSSACSDNNPDTSKVLKAMNITDDIGRGVVRVSLCHETTEEQFNYILESVKTSLDKLIKIQSY